MGPSAHLLSALDTCTPGVWARVDVCGSGDTGRRGGAVCVMVTLPGLDLACGSGGHGGLGHVDTLPARALVCAHPHVHSRVGIPVRVREARAGDFLGGCSGSVLWEALGRGWAAAAPAAALASALHSCEERQKQEEEGGAQARVLRELHADPRGGGAH